MSDNKVIIGAYGAVLVSGETGDEGKPYGYEQSGQYPCTADAYIREEAPDDDSQLDNRLVAFQVWNGFELIEFQYALVQFDVGPSDPGYLYLFGDDEKVTVTEAFPITSAWDEAVTWNTMPSIGMSLGMAEYEPAAFAIGWNRWDVGSYNTHGYMIRMDATQEGLSNIFDDRTAFINPWGLLPQRRPIFVIFP